MTLLSLAVRKSKITLPEGGSRMTALLQSTPPRARNPLDLAFLIETGSATTQLMESGSALAMQLPLNTTCQG